ncbi:MAG: molybdate ABC transporter permease subunit [Acidobacteriota bacterium]
MMIDWFPIRLSFQVSALATLIALMVGVGVAWVLARRQFRGKEWLDAFITLPLVLPPTVLGYYLLVLLGQRSPLGRMLQSVGITLTFTPAAAVIAATIHALPLMVKSVRSAFEEVSPMLENAARTLGASELRVFSTITLPLARRHVLSASVLAFARALGDFGVTIMIAGNIPGKTQTASVAIYDAMLAGRDGEALVFVGLITGLCAMVLYTTNRLSGASLR